MTDEPTTKGKLRYQLNKLRRARNALEVAINGDTAALMEKHLRLIAIKAELKAHRKIKRDHLKQARNQVSTVTKEKERNDAHRVN